MIDSTFYGLLSTQIEEMKSANSAQQNKLLLQIAKLALAEIDTSEGVMAEYDKLDTRVLFSTFGDIGVLIREFFEENKERLDPVALNGKIGEKLLETTAAIAETTDSIKQLEVTEAKLLSAEPQLRSLQAQYQDLKARLDELRTIQNVATPEILLQMEHDIAHLRTMTKEASEKKMQLQTVLDELSNAQQNMQNEQQLLGSGILDIVRKYDDTLSALLRTYGSSAQESTVYKGLHRVGI